MLQGATACSAAAGTTMHFEKSNSELICRIGYSLTYVSFHLSAVSVPYWAFWGGGRNISI